MLLEIGRECYLSFLLDMWDLCNLLIYLIHYCRLWEVMHVSLDETIYLQRGCLFFLLVH